MEASPNRPIFLLHAWPDVVSALEGLVGALLNKGRAARNVRKAMEKLCLAMAAFIDPASGNGIRRVVLPCFPIWDGTLSVLSTKDLKLFESNFGCVDSAVLRGLMRVDNPLWRCVSWAACSLGRENLGRSEPLQMWNNIRGAARARKNCDIYNMYLLCIYRNPGEYFCPGRSGECGCCVARARSIRALYTTISGGGGGEIRTEYDY